MYFWSTGQAGWHLGWGSRITSLCVFDGLTRAQAASVTDQSLYSNLNGKLEVPCVFPMGTMRLEVFPPMVRLPLSRPTVQTRAHLANLSKPAGWRSWVRGRPWHSKPGINPSCQRAPNQPDECVTEQEWCWTPASSRGAVPPPPPADCGPWPSHVKLKRPQRECKF